LEIIFFRWKFGENSPVRKRKRTLSHLAGSQIWLNLSFLWTLLYFYFLFNASCGPSSPISLNDNIDPKKIDLGFFFSSVKNYLSS